MAIKSSISGRVTDGQFIVKTNFFAIDNQPSFGLFIKFRAKLLIEHLNTNFMDEKMGVNVVDLRSDGQCPGTLTLRVIDKEKKGEKYPYLSSLGASFYLFPDQYNKQIVKYIENRLHGSGVKTDDVVGKDTQVSIEEVKETVIPMVVAGLYKGWVKLRISIPEIDYTKSTQATTKVP